jgi:hypothetical protein
MNDSTLIRIGFAMLAVGFGACRTQPQTWPADAADLTGQIIEVQLTRGLDGLSISGTGSVAASGDIQRLRVRVLGARTTAPGSDAIVGVDGVTSVVRGRASGGADGHRLELEGAYVRIWFRGLPRKSTPTQLTAMARVMAIDSVATPAR